MVHELYSRARLHGMTESYDGRGRRARLLAELLDKYEEEDSLSLSLSSRSFVPKLSLEAADLDELHVSRIRR